MPSRPGPSSAPPARCWSGTRGLGGCWATRPPTSWAGRDRAARRRDALAFFGPRDHRWSGTLELRHRDGGTVSAWVLAHRRPAPDGGPGTWLAVSPPDRRPAGEPGDPLAEAALTQSPCATMIFDERLRLHGVNDAMARLLELPAERLRGLRPTDIGSRPQHTELEEQVRRVLATGRGHDMQTYMKAAGRNAAPTPGWPGSPRSPAPTAGCGASASPPTTSPSSTAPGNGCNWSTRPACASAPRSTSPAPPRNWPRCACPRSPTSSASTCSTPGSTARRPPARRPRR